MKGRFTLSLVLLVLGLAAPGILPAAPQDDPAGEVSAKARDATIERGMEYLDSKLWSLQSYGSPRQQYTAAVTGWAYLLAADKGEKGSKKFRAKKKEIERIAGYLRRYAEEVAKDYEQDDEKAEKAKRKGKKDRREQGGDPFANFDFMSRSQYNWPLGIAAHFFAECSKRGKSKKDAKAGLQAIVKVLESSQQVNGGWGHDDLQREGMGLPKIPIPKPGGGHGEYPGTLLAASNCALSGLGVAHAALKTKEAPSLERGCEYFESAQHPNGAFPYDPSQKFSEDLPTDIAVDIAGGIDLARSSGCVFAMLCAGEDADSPSVRKALEAIDAHVELCSEGHGSATMALMFSALLARARGEEAWARFRREYFPRIIAAQEAGGAFTCVCSGESLAVTCDTRPLPGTEAFPAFAEGAKAYVTSIHLLILLLDRSELRAVPAMPAPRVPETPGGGG